MEHLKVRSVASIFVFLILYCILRVVYTLWWRPRSHENQLKQQGIKGTSYKLLHGDMKDISKLMKEAWSKPMSLNHHIAPRVIPFFHQVVQNYGKISVNWQGTRARLVVAEPELMRLILIDKDGHFSKPPLNPLVNLLQLGLSTLEGDKWAKRRRLITPAFHQAKIQGMLPAFLTSCSNLIDQWKKMVGSEGSCEVDVMPDLQNLSSDVIARAGFGSSYEEGKRIFELQKEQAKLVIEAFQSTYIPGLRFIPTKKNKRRYEIDSEIKATLRLMIHQKEEAMINGESDNDDLLGLLLQCKGNTNNELTIEDLVEECKLFYFAGQETTANWLTWTVIVLCMHPTWQEKAREEVLQICGKQRPNTEQINQLKIVSMVLNEILRLYPPVVGLFRHTCRKTSVGGKTIPAGVDIYLPTLLLQHDPEYWGDDAEEFKPERFAGGVSKAAATEKMAFYPFGWGPRFCLGQVFAMIEAKLALAMILQHFSFELSPSYTHAPHTVITLQPQYGAPVILHQI